MLVLLSSYRKIWLDHKQVLLEKIASNH